jgi:hypothetical protein
VFNFATDLDHVADTYVVTDERRAIKPLRKGSELSSTRLRGAAVAHS